MKVDIFNLDRKYDIIYADPPWAYKDKKIRGGAGNHHHMFRYIYEIYERIDKKDNIFREKGTSTYPIYENDKMAKYIFKYGEKIKKV